MASLYEAQTLFKRCLACPDETPSCPTCDTGEVCSLVTASCDECAKTVCVSSGATTESTTSSSGSIDVGAIAGGVVGGVVFIALATFLVWWFWIRPRRELEEEYEEEWEDEDQDAEAKSQFREAAGARASVHTMHSIASSVMSRASNMIPIAFIPGVTNRDDRPATPPVPPIPAARRYTPSPLSSIRSDGDAIFFSPGDLRNSAYSAVSSLDSADRRSVLTGRASITPSLARESIASDVYHDNATLHPMPAETAIMTKPNMVSVKIGSTGANSPLTPGSGVALSSPSSNGSLRSLGKKGQRFPVRTASGASTKPSIRSPLAVDSEGEEPKQSLLGNAATPTTSTSPFSDDNEIGVARTTSGRYTNGGLTSVAEEASKRLSELIPLAVSSDAGRQASPFGDEHAHNEDGKADK